MTIKKKVTISILVVGVLFLLLAVWYKHEYSMDPAKGFEINNPNHAPKLLIATQGSAFKNEITKRIVNYYQQDSIFIKVIDISSLQKIDPKDFDALLIIHTWENWEPPADVNYFIDRTKAYKDKIVVLTTSGKGTFKMEDTDAITSESKLKNAESYTNKIIQRLNPLLKP